MDKPTKLFNRNYLLLWQGQAVSKLGTQVFQIAVIFWLVEATGSATIMGLMAMLTSIPALILGPVGGTLADRYSRKKIIIICDALNGFAVITLAGLIYFTPGKTQLLVFGLFVVSIFIATVNSFFFPAISAAIPDLVPKEKLAGANTRAQLSSQVATLVGQGLGGVFYNMLGAALIYLINGFSYLYTAFSESFVQIPQKISKSESNWKQQFASFKIDMKEGFKYIWHRPGLRELLLISIILNFFVTPVLILLPFFVEKFLNLGDQWHQWFGFLMASYVTGTTIGFILGGVIRFKGKIRGKILLVFIILDAALHGLLGITSSPVIVLVLAFISGYFGGFVTVYITTILQWTTPSEIRGRVFGLLATVGGAITPIAMGLSGAIADLVNQNIPLIYLVCGGIMVILTVIISFSKNYRDYLAYDVQAQDNVSSQETPGMATELT